MKRGLCGRLIGLLIRHQPCLCAQTRLFIVVELLWLLPTVLCQWRARGGFGCEEFGTTVSQPIFATWQAHRECIRGPSPECTWVREETSGCFVSGWFWSGRREANTHGEIDTRRGRCGQSAARSKERRLKYTRDLEQKVTQLQEEVVQLRRQLEQEKEDKQRAAGAGSSRFAYRSVRRRKLKEGGAIPLFPWNLILHTLPKR